MTSLKQKAISGIKWSAVSQIGRQATLVLTTIILARLLPPSDFGLVSMAMVVIGVVTIFKDLGTSAAIIQQKELSEILLSSVYWVQVGFGAIAMLILFLAAPLGGWFYRDLRVVGVLQVLSTTFFISGLGILQQSLLERTLSFHVLAKLELASALLGAIVGVLLALVNAGVWSLVFQTLTTFVLTTVFLWFTGTWRPRWMFRWEEVKRVSGFSLNLVGFNLFNYAARNADYLLIGRYLGATELGFYLLAYRILLFPIQNISAVIGRVMYPVLASYQDDARQFASSYLKVAGNIAILSFPLMTGAVLLAKPLILTFLGETWRPVIPLIMIFAPVGLVHSIGTTVGMIYQAKGRTDWMFRWGVGSSTLVVLAFIIGLRWGSIGVAAAYAIAAFILIYPSFSIPFRLTEIRFKQLLRVLQPSFLSSAWMVLGLLLFRFALPSTLSDPIYLLSAVLFGVLAYGAASWFLNREQIVGVLELMGRKEGETV